MEPQYETVVRALAAAGIEAELERTESGQLLLTIRGEAVDSWVDDKGPYVSVVVEEARSD